MINSPAVETRLAEDAFSPDTGNEPLLSTLLRILAEILLLGVLAAFVLSPGEISHRHRVMMALLGLTLPWMAWGVYRSRLSGAGFRLWLLFGGSFVLSLAVRGQSLTRPPSMLAAGCAMGLGVAGLLSALFSRGRFRPTRFEPGMAAAVLLLGLTLLIFFPSVGVQNSLDGEVLHNALGALLDYTLLLCGLSVISSSRSSYARAAVVLGIACLLRLILHL